MANGFTYESPLNRLLSVTLPRFIEGQLQRQQRQREFDEQMEFREKQFEALEDQREQQQLNFEQRRQDAIDEKNALEAQDNEVFSVQSVREASTVDEAMAMLSALEGAIKTSKGRNHFKREKARLGKIESQRGATLNLFKDYLSEEDMQALKSSFGLREIKPSEVLSFIGADLKIEDMQTDRQLARIGTKFDMQSKILSSASAALNKLPSPVPGMAEPKEISDQRESLSNRMTNATNTLSSLFDEYNTILAQHGKEAPEPTPVLQPFYAQYPYIPVVGRDITPSDLENLSVGATFDAGGMRMVKEAEGQYKPADDGDFELINDFIKSDDDLKKDIYIDGVPAAEEPSPEPTEPLSVGVDDAGALGRLAGREAEYDTPVLHDIGGKLGDLLRLAPTQQEMMGTGEGSRLTYGGAQSGDIKGMRQLKKGLTSTINELQADRSFYARIPNPPTEETDKEYIAGVDKKNKELQFLLRNGYQALVSTKNPRIKKNLKESLDNAIAEIESEISKTKIAQKREGGVGQRVYSMPLISEDTISLINAIKASTRLPEQAQIGGEGETLNVLNLIQNQ